MGILVSNDPMYGQKCNEYMDYLTKHINNVHRSFERLFKNSQIDTIRVDDRTDEQIMYILNILEQDILNHDKSKYTDIEFYPYRMYFYPTNLEKEKMKVDPDFNKKCEEEMEEAWHHHYTHNYHHPEFYLWNDISDPSLMDSGLSATYILRDTKKDVADDMPLIAIYHMIADWDSFSNGARTVDWYIEDGKEVRSAMSPKTKEIVELLLSKLYNVNIDIFKEN